jgi:hypothetical protein
MSDLNNAAVPASTSSPSTLSLPEQEKHHQYQKMMNIHQLYGEKAAEYLKQVWKQRMLCQSIGFYEFNENDVIVNIILEGINSNIRAYSATIVELNATLCRCLDELSLVKLEETFFTINDNLSRKKNEKEQVAIKFPRLNLYEYKLDYFYKTKERKKRRRDDFFGFLVSPICAANGKHCSTD